MGTMRLSARSVRRIERATGLEILRAWGHGGYTFGFVTPDHRHGSYDRKTGDWAWHERPVHYTSCSEMFPDWDPQADVPVRPAATVAGAVSPGRLREMEARLLAEAAARPPR